MPDTKSELNDIILNKSDSSFSGFKKILLAVASFAVLLIIVVVVMSSINGDSKNQLATTILPPEPITNTDEAKSELFKSVTVDQENSDDEQKRLESIANEIKQQTLPPVVTPDDKEDSVVVNNDEIVTIDDPYEEPVKPKKVTPVKTKKVTPVKTKKTTPKKIVKAKKGNWYVQVGSFAHLKPHKRLIAKIERLGFSYRQYKSNVKGKAMTKLLIGPYATNKEAQKAKPKIRAEIESAAFIFQMVQ